MVIPSPRIHEEVSGEGEEDTTVVRKVFQTNAVALQYTLEILEIEAIKEAVQLLLTARQILVVGVGGSGPAVTYTGNRFLLLGLKAFMCTDFYLMLMAASLLSRGDVVLAISNLGTTREIVETVGIAREKQARIMCITNNSLSPLARVCNPVLVTASREVTLPEEAVASLVCQIAILDALFALIAGAQGAQSRETLNDMEEAMVKVGVMRQPAK
jgi:DNA-binding MurR/RpiR family transcriptional regulator